ncbi:M56 family metallopeptidase [Mucilaginibacter sp.]|uniref:M56 family metallopeptidase n=1 Tax=Mucilaginibacter sp. TaxID=1882438 RepID=UPI00260B13D3|nr:M56 family metallopeptidase [Mucilaginibacter sp.]MDB5032130.1 hypothetical protein [Mucilaginibacter sp.]
MPALFVFLLKVNIALIVFCLGYYFVLRQLTFYTLNRVYLSIAIIFSTLYPLINLDSFVQQHQQLAVPAQSVMINWKTPAEHFIQQPDYWYWATIVFWIGAALFAGKLLMQLVSLFKLYKNSKPGKIQEHDVRIVKANISPFSFWQSIYINPDNLNPGDLNGILQHEQIHVTEWHTMDILLAEISVIFYWFNPGVWLIKKAVRENIEFITDRKILQKGMDSKTYQYSLLNVSFAATTSAGITNHFNFSTLKKRIIMMNAKRSSAINLTRYAFLVPVVLICLFAFSLSKAELVKKSRVVYKTFKASVNSIATTVSTDQVISAKKPVALKKTDTDKKTNSIVVVSTHSTDSDTSKKQELKVIKNNDSVNYYVDGKKVNAEYFETIPSNGIQEITVIKNGGDDNSILATTKNNVTIGTIATTTANVNSIGKSSDLSFKTADGTKVKGFISNKNAITISNLQLTDTGKAKTQYRNNISTSGNNFSTINLPAKKTEYRINVGSAGGHFFESVINNPSDKLIFIDGKEATPKDIKKLSLSMIKSISMPSDKNATERYGEKAKNGAIFITTK